MRFIDWNLNVLNYKWKFNEYRNEDNVNGIDLERKLSNVLVCLEYLLWEFNTFLEFVFMAYGTRQP